MNFHRHFTWLSLILAGLVLLSSCLEDPEDNNKGNNNNNNNNKPEQKVEALPKSTTVRGVDINGKEGVIQMPQSAVFVQDDINSGLIGYDEASGTLTFSQSIALENAGIKAGDILYSAPIPGKVGKGYIVKVKTIQNEGGNIVITTEPANFEDAFEKVNIPVPVEMEKVQENNITVFDPLKQPDASSLTETLQTKSLVNFSLDLTYLDQTYDKDKYKLDISNKSTELTIVLFDADDDFKTKSDQLNLIVKLDYSDFWNEGVFNFDKNTWHLEVGLKPRIGLSSTLKYTYEKSKSSKAEKQYLMNQMEKKLMGKKVKIASIDIPIGETASKFVQPRVDIYATFKFSISGTFEITAGISDIGLDFHIENYPNDFLLTNKDKTYLKTPDEKPVPIFEIEADANLKGSAGIGCGFVVGLPKIANKFFDSMTKPYVGWFYEVTAVAEGTFSAEYDLYEAKMMGSLDGSAYIESEGFAEGYVKLNNGFLWNPKVDFENAHRTWPTPPLKFHKEFEMLSERPVPIQTYPKDGDVVEESDVELKWALAPHDLSTMTTGHYVDVIYDVYLSTDKVLVEQSSPKARIAGGISKTNCRYSIKSLDTYYWKVVSHNSLKEDFESEVNSFDSGSSGVITFNDKLAKYLLSNKEALPGVHFKEDGSIEMSPSNLNAFKTITSLTIRDQAGEYGIDDIDELLKCLPALKSLDCSYNSISSLNLSGNASLRDIDCSFNGLKTLKTSVCPDLEVLTCKSNDLKSLDMSSNKKLTTLSCSDNKNLFAIDVRNCYALKNLTCSGCSIESLDISKNIYLFELYVAENKLDFLDISNCLELKRLDIYSQAKEKIVLRLSHSQMTGFIDFKRHFNTIFEYIEDFMIATGKATDITTTSAKVQASLLIGLDIVECGIIYSSINSEPDLSNSTYVKSKSNDNTFEATLTGLEPGRNYYARGYVKTSTGGQRTIYGDITSFVTNTSNGAGVNDVPGKRL